VKGAGKNTFEKIAKEVCPISKLLNTEITLTTILK
jgi:organic hydroperoxide reductase OsmC/OhrA